MEAMERGASPPLHSIPTYGEEPPPVEEEEEAMKRLTFKSRIDMGWFVAEKGDSVTLDDRTAQRVIDACGDAVKVSKQKKTADAEPEDDGPAKRAGIPGAPAPNAKDRRQRPVVGK